MILTSLKRYIIFSLITIIPSLVLALEMPEQKFTIALPITNYTKTTYVTSTSGSLPVGFAAEYGIFLKSDLSLDGQFQVNLESSEQSIVFLGGAGGLKWYLIGGATERYLDSFVSSVGTSNLNVYINGGFGSKTFDFRILEKNLAKIRDAKDPATGNVFGLNFGVGAEYPLISYFLAGMRLQMFKSFSGSNTPDLNTMEIWITTSYIL